MDTTPAIEARLDELQRESDLRREELKAIAAALPEATSRRLLVRQMVVELVRAPDRSSVARRAVLKVLRTPTDLARRLRRS